MGGCFSSKQVSAESFRIEIKKLRIYLDVQSTKKMAQCQELEKMLLNELRKTFGRSASVESSLIEQIVTGINHIHAFYFLKSQCDRLVDYSHHINDKKKAELTLFPAFKMILYTDPIISNQEVHTHCRTIKHHFPELTECSDAQMPSDILRHHKHNDDPTPKMQNDYVLDLCNREQLNLGQINLVGHSFRFG